MSRDELIEKMCEADCNSRDGPPWNKWKDKDEWRVGMSAALDMMVGELLGEPTKEETTRHYVTSAVWDIESHRHYADMLEYRRARYLKPKTVEERVTIEEIASGLYSFSIQLDKEIKAYVIRSPYGIGADRTMAQSLVRGVIAKLKAEVQS